MRRAAHIAVALVAVLLWGCEVPGQRVRTEEWLDAQGPGPMDAIGIEASLEVDPKPTYVLGRGDVIGLVVEQNPEHSGKVAVDWRGQIVVPGLRVVVDIEGLELARAERTVRRALAPFLVGPPAVRVEILEVHSKFFYVFGAVAIPGRHRMGILPLAVRDAVIRSGLFTEWRAADTRVCLIRPDTVKPTYVVIDLRRVLRGHLKHNLPVRNGDVIFVPDTLYYKFDMFVDILARQIEDIRTVDQAVAFVEDASNKVRTAGFRDQRY